MENKKNEIIIDGLKIRTFELPPDGFDPLTAEQSKLQYYGIVARPDKDKEPELYKRWHSVYSKKLKYIVPEFKEIKRKGPGGNNKKVSFDSYTPKTWSGVVVDSSSKLTAGNPFKTVEALILIPPISLNLNVGYSNPALYNLSFAAWIGIDGKNTSDPPLQVGITLAQGEFETYFPIFWQWKNSNPHIISNLATDFKDTLYCLICADAIPPGHSNPSASTAWICITNTRTHEYTSFEVTAPAGTWEGKTAEWIVENIYGNDSPPILLTNFQNYNPDFSNSYTFTQCMAGYQGPHGLVHVNSNSGGVVNMPETITTTEGANSVVVMNRP